MPYRWSDLKKYLHYLTPQQQVSEINKLTDGLILLTLIKNTT